MITRKYIGVVVCFGIVTTILLILWNANRRDELYVKILNDDSFATLAAVASEEGLYDLNFEYIMKSETCRRGNRTADDFFFLAVIIVTSHIANVERRSAMRRAFSEEALETLGLRRVFLTGTAEDGQYMTEVALRDEARRFGDIVQGNFREAYRNLTYKHVMGLRWASKFCPNVKYVVKMDDDIVFDVHRIVSLMEGLKLPSDNYICGYILKGMVPIREPANKWYTTLEEYGAASYPTFVSGWFYITTVKFCRDLVAQAKLEPYFWIDDVLVTGILAQKLGGRFLNLNKYYAVHAELMQCCLQDLDRFRCDFLIGPNGGNDDMFYAFNELAKKCLSSNCPVRSKPLNVSCVVTEKDASLGRGNAIVEPYKLA